MPQPNLYTGDGTFLDSRDVIANFFIALEAAEASIWSPMISGDIVPSDREIEQYAWLGQVPVMREWVGGRHEQFLKKYSLQIRNVVFEATLPMSVEDLRRDKRGELRRKASELGTRTITHWDTLLAPLVVAGEAGTLGLGYDGQFFFDTDHDESGSNQTNDLTATEVPSANVADPNVPTVAEAVAIINETVSYAMSFTDDQGEPINQSAREVLILVTKPLHLAAFNGAVTLNVLAAGVDNPLRGLREKGWTFRVEYVSRMTAANKVYFFIGGQSNGTALIRQEDGGIVTQIQGAGSHEEFTNNRHLFGVKAVRGVGFGAWNKAVLVTLS